MVEAELVEAVACKDPPAVSMDKPWYKDIAYGSVRLDLVRVRKGLY